MANCHTVLSHKDI